MQFLFSCGDRRFFTDVIVYILAYGMYQTYSKEMDSMDTKSI